MSEEIHNFCALSGRISVGYGGFTLHEFAYSINPLKIVSRCVNVFVLF